MRPAADQGGDLRGCQTEELSDTASVGTTNSTSAAV